MTIFRKLFLLDALERAIKTFAQALVAVLTSGAVGILDVDWKSGLSVSALAAVVSLLTSIASAGSGNSPSLVVDNKEK